MGTNREQSRRTFLGAFGAGVLAQGCGRVPFAASSRMNRDDALSSSVRAERAYQMRREVAEFHRNQPLPADAANGDDDRYANRCASYSKGLPHNDSGEVEPTAYSALLRAIRSGLSADFAAIPIGGSLKLANPQAAYTYLLQGCDPYSVDLRAAPAFASAESAADMAEVYWHAVLRDVPVDSFGDNALAEMASDDLSRFSEYRGPKTLGRVTPAVLFRGHSSGDLIGPYVSQFLYARVPQGVYSLEQRFRTPRAAVDFVTTGAEWLAQQRGAEAFTDPELHVERRYIRTGRDLTRFVHRDYTFQVFLNAALILLSLGERYLSPTPYYPMACAFASSRPRLTTESAFSTFGPPQVLDAVTAVANLALHATWRQKWILHRRLRPEAFAHRVDRTLNQGAKYPVHSELLSSRVSKCLTQGNLLLPMAYPEGAPAHPSYPAGHAAIAGACVTVLKAFFREDALFPAPVKPAHDGLTLLPYESEPLTVGGELDKLASNISTGRNFAGVHYRSDGVEGMDLGESVALSYLADIRRCLTEDFDGFALTTFRGRTVTI